MCDTWYILHVARHNRLGYGPALVLRYTVLQPETSVDEFGNFRAGAASSEVSANAALGGALFLPSSLPSLAPFLLSFLPTLFGSLLSVLT